MRKNFSGSSRLSMAFMVSRSRCDVDPIDLVGAKEEQAASRLYDQAIGARLIAAQVLDQGQQAAPQIAALIALDLFARALQRVGEPLAVERFEQVVERADLECAQRVLIVGGDEDDQRHALAADRFDHFEAVHLRHLNIEEDEIRLVIDDGGHGFFSVAALRDDLDIAFTGQQRGKSLPREWFIVHDQRPDFLHIVCPR